MPQYLYEELKAKKIEPIKLPIDLAYSVPYLTRTDRVLGSEIITYKPIQFNKN